jgi:hypothetical protein
VSEENTPFDQPGWRLNDAACCFDWAARAEATARRRRTPSSATSTPTSRRCWARQEHPLFGFEAREHTAQVDGERRAIREKRFRYGEKEREELTAEDKRLREIGEAEPLPPGPVLLADDGARRRHLGPQRRAHAQRAAHARELRAAERSRRAAAGRPPSS